MSTLPLTEWRELDRRRGDGLDIALLWSREDDRVKVVVADLRRGGGFELDVAPAEALSAFHHPFALAAARASGPHAAAATRHLQPQG